MEENKEVKKEVKKLTYSQLEEAARQLSSQMDNIIKENQQLKMLIQKQQLENLFAELNFRFKVLTNSEHFPKEFVQRVTNEIVEVMTPKLMEEEAKEE